MGLLARLAPRKGEADVAAVQALAADDPVFATKALRKFLKCLASRPSPILLDLGAVVGSNISFFGAQLGCKIFVEDVFADLDRHVRAGTVDGLPAFLKARLSHASGTVDGILCWDIIDYLDRRAAEALAAELTRVLRPEGALLGFFGTTPTRDTRCTKYIVIDEVNLQYRASPVARRRQAVLLNRDIIRLFPSLHVSDSFLLQNTLREILFRKPV